MKLVLPIVLGSLTFALLLSACSSNETTPHPVPTDAAKDSSSVEDAPSADASSTDAANDGGPE
jgi:hypothetical protein